MAEGKQYQVSLTIDANVDRAKKAMKQLQSDLDKLSTSALTLTPATKIDKDLIQASQAAAQLKVNLESAFNVKTGNLDLVKFNQSMKSAGMSAQKYQEALSSLGPAGDQAFSQLAMAVAKADAPFARVNSKLNEFATSLKNTAKWQISSSILHGLTSSINQAFSYAQQLNSSLNDIRIVTGASADEMAKFAAQANQAAKSLSTSTRSYADAALIFYQQGLGDAAVKERTDAVIKMANVTKDSAAEVSSYMTAIWNNFDDGSKSLEHYADVMTALGAATASSTAEIADGLEKFASIGKTIGLSYDYATSALATIVSQTRQSADTVGTGLRTIFSRLQGLSLGETLEDGVNLNKYSKALGAVGVSILDATGNMKDMDSILDSLASKWDNLTNAQKTALAQTVGGVRQYTTLISLMDNWDSMETNLTTAKSSSGALQEQANIYAESWDAAKNRVKASAEAIYSSLINDDFFIGLNNGFAGFLDQVNNLIEGLGGLKGVLMSLTPIVTALFRNQINSGIRSMVSSIQNFTPSGRAKNEAVRTSFVNQAMNMHRNDASIGGAAMADQQRRVAQMQFAYMQGSSKMTEEQRSNAQYLMQQYEGVTARVQKAGDAANNASQRARDVDITTQTAVSEKGKEYAKKEQEKQDAKKQEAIAEAEEKRQSQLDEIERKRQERVQELQEQKRRQVKTRRGPIDNEIRIENEKAAAARERINREYNKKVKTAEQTHATDSADIAKKQQRAEEAREKFTQQVRAEAFTKETTAAVMDVKINGKEDIDAAKERLKALAAMIKKVAAEQDIDLGSPDEDGSYAQALQAIETAANDANASVESLQEAQNGLNTAFEGGQFGPKPAPGEKSAEEEYSEAMDDLGATADEKHMGEIKSAAAAEGTAIARVAEESAVAEQAAGQLNETLNEMSSVKLDFASGFTASLSAITAVGAALSSVQGLMDLWGDSSASVGEKLLGTLTTVATVAGSLGSAFSGTNGQLLTMMGNLLLTKLGFTGVTGAMAGTAAASGPAAGGLGTVGTVGAASGTAIQIAFWPIVVVMLAIAAAVALVVGVMAGIQALSNIYNADAIAAEQAAEAARNLASAYGEAQEKYNSMIQTMDNYSSARAALDSLTEGTEAYNAALSQANEAGLALINSMPDLKAGEDYRWENGELIIDQEAMDRVKKAEAGKVAEARAASVMADAHASTAKAKADKTEFVRQNDQSGWAGAGAGAALGATYGAILGPWGAAIGGLLGGVVGLGATLFNNKSENDVESERIDKLVADYETLGEKAFDPEHLESLGFTDVTDEYREGLMEVVKATSQATQQTTLAARLAAEELLALDEDYNRIKDKDTKDNIGAAGGRVYQSLEDKYYQEYLTNAGDRGLLFNTGTDTSEQAFKEYAELMGLQDYDATDFIGRGEDSSVKYTYTDENGEKQEKTVTAKEMARRLAAAKAADEFDNSSAFLMDEFERLDKEGKGGLADFLGGDLTQSTRSEWGQITNAFDSSEPITAENAMSYLGQEFGGENGILDDAEAQKYGYESAAKMAEAFKDEYNRTMTAWEDIALPGGLGEWSESLSLEAAQKLENITENLNLGPLGDSAGDAFAAGLNQMLEGVNADEQTAALNQLMSIDWSSWDALSQADAILQEFGVDLDLTSEQWVTFASNMRLASRSIPDFSKLKSDFTSISKIIGDLEFGEAIGEEEYQTLIAYNQEWSKFFVMQADGSRKFIGNAKDMATATREMALEQRDLLDTYSAAAENDAITGFDWDQELNTEDKLASAKADFAELLKSENGGAELTSVMEALGYGDFDWQNATAEQLQAMFDAIYSAIDPTHISQIDDEFQEMYASTATSLSELQGMLTSKTIDGDTYSKSLIAMASGYEYCTSAIKAYQEAIGTDGEAEALEALEAAVEAEEAASKLETTYSHAMSGKSSMTVEDLNALKEGNEELYDSFLTISDEQWYEAAYEAYQEFLTQRMAGHAQESAEYKAMLMEKEQAENEYYERQKEKAQQVREAQQEQWDKQVSGASNAMDTLQSSLSSTEPMSFAEIEELRENLRQAGIEGTRLDEIIRGLGKTDGSSAEQVRAKITAATEAALGQIGAQAAERKQYDSLVSVHVKNKDGLGKEIEEAIDGADTTLSADITNGEDLIGQIQSIVSNGEGGYSVTIKTATGETLVGQIQDIVSNGTGGYSVTIKTATGDTLVTQVQGIVQNGEGYSITIKTATGETLTGQIQGIVQNGEGYSVTIKTATGDTLVGQIQGIVQNGEGYSVTIKTATGDTLVGQIQGIVQNGEGYSVTIKTATGDTLVGQIQGIVSNGEGYSVTIKTVTGETLTGQIQGIVSNGEGYSITIKTATGDTLTGQIQGIVSNGEDEYSVTIKTATGDTLVGQIQSIVSNGEGGYSVTITTATGETLVGQIQGIVSNGTGGYSVTIKMDKDGSTVTADVTGVMATTKGFVKAGLASTAGADLNAELDELNLEANVTLKISQDASTTAWLNERIGRLSNLIIDGENGTEHFNKLNDIINKGYGRDENSEFYKNIGSGADWGYYQKYMASSMVNNLVGYSTEEIEQLKNSGALTDFITALQETITSGADADTKEYARMLLIGLGQGLRDTDIDWQTYVDGIGVSLDAAFRQALGIHSPSRLTMALAPYLFDGLSLGISEAAAAWQCPELDGLSSKIAAKLRKSLEDASKVSATTGAKVFSTVFGNIEGISQEDQEIVSGVLASDGATTSEKIKNWARQKAIENQGLTSVPPKLGRPRLMEFDEHRSVEEYLQQQTEKYEQQAEEAIQRSTEAYNEDFYTNKRWHEQDSGFSKYEAAIVDDAIEQVLKDNAWDSIEEALADGTKDFTQLLQNEFDKQALELNISISKTWAQIKDIWVEGLSQIYGEEQAAAKKTLTTWENTFKAIAKIRLEALEGKSAMESMYDDPEALSALIASYLNEGQGIDQIIANLKDKNSTYNFTAWDAEAYHLSGPQRFLNRTNGKYSNTTTAQYKQNAETYFTGLADENLYDAVSKVFTSTYLAQLKNDTSAEGRGLIEQLVAQGILNQSETGDLTLVDAETFKTVEAVNEVINSLVEAVTLGYTDTDAGRANLNSLLATARIEQESKAYKLANTARQEGEAYIDKQQNKVNLVDKARGILAKNGDLTKELTYAEQEALKEITGKADLTAVSLGDLDSATTTLANTMQIAAQQIAVAMGMIQRGEATGFSIGSDGTIKVTRQMAYADARAQGYTISEADETAAQNAAIAAANEAAVASQGSASSTQAAFDTTKNNYTVTVEVDLNGDPIDTGNDGITNAMDASGASARQAAETYATSAGFTDADEMNDYIRMMETAGDNDDYSDGGMLTAEEIMNASSADEIDTMKEAIALQREYAAQLKNMEEGLSELNESGKDWLKTLKDANASISDQSKALGNLRKSYQKVLGLDDGQMEKLGDDFLTNAENLKLVQTAAEETGEKGAEALNQLQANAALAVLKTADLGEALDTIDEIIAKYGTLAETIGNMKFNAGDVITGTDEAYSSLSGLFNGIVADARAAGNSVESSMEIARNAISALGFTPSPLELETITMSAQGFQTYVSDHNITTAYDQQGNPFSVSDIATAVAPNDDGTYTVQVPRGVNSPGVPQSFTKTAEKTGGGGRRGGGGGSRRRYLAKAKPEDHKERYHEINNAIDDVSDALERLNKQQDRAWGSARIKAMQEEAALLKEQTELYHQKRKEAEEYLKTDRKKAEEAGWTFDENGNVSNYEERLNAVIAEYNQKIEEYNAMSAQEQEAKEKLITEANERFEKGDKDAEQYLNPETGVAFSSYEEYLKYMFFDAPQEALETYEGTMEEWEEIQKSILTNLYAEYDNYVEQIKYTAENMLEFIDDQIKYIEHKLSRMEDNAYKTAESIELIASQIEASESKIATAESELAALLGAHSIDVEDFLTGKVSADDLKNAGFTDAEIEELRNIMTTAQDAEKDMSETLTKGIESMSTAFESFNAELDRYTSSIEHAQSITSTYRNILDLTGKSLSGFSVELLKAFNESTIEQAKANMSANKTKYETVQVEYDKALQVWELAQAQYAAGLMEDSAYLQAKKTFEDTEDALQEAQESYISSWEAAIQAVADAYQSTMEAVIEDVSKKLANGMTGGLDALSEYMDRAKTTESNYVDDYEKIYQLTKLTRDLDSKIDNTQNVKTQKELLKFQKEINELLQSDKQLSEYDIDYLQKKYDLKLAEIALEDAQNAKSQVTMRRDSEGNYNYVYTADENAVAEAEAEYEGKLYEMQKANDEYITSLSDNIISLEQEMLQAIGALDPAQFASEEDYNNRVADIIKFYTEQMEYQSSEMGKVLANNKSLYDNDMKWYAEYRDYKMADAATFLDSWDKILLAQVSGFSTQEEFFNNFKQQAGSLANESLGAYATWAQKIGEINTSAGTSTGTLGEDIGKQVQELTDDAKEAAEKMETSAGKIKDSVTGITGAVIGMLDEFEGRVGAAADKVDLLTLSIMSLFKTLGVDGFENLQLDGKLSELWLKIQATENAKPTATTSEDGPDTGYDTGGYTGSWGTEGRLAFLHQKELVLNAEDTANMLASVGILRQIASVIDLNALTSAGGFANLSSSGISHNREPLQQEVHIEAHFPNATDKNQIEEAFNDIINLASQYANSF